MKRLCRLIVAAALSLSIATPLLAQFNRDPLNDKEVNELRETAQEPHARMKLLIKFTQRRMDKINVLRADPKMATANAPEIGQLLSDVANLLDEVDDNLSMYDGQGEDMRKSLRGVIEMDTDIRAKLKALKENSTPEQMEQYKFAIEDADESASASADNAHALLSDEMAKKGKEKPDKEKSAKGKKKKKADEAKSKEPKQRPDYTGMGGLGNPKR